MRGHGEIQDGGAGAGGGDLAGAGLTHSGGELKIRIHGGSFPHGDQGGRGSRQRRMRATVRTATTCSGTPSADTTSAARASSGHNARRVRATAHDERERGR